MMQIKFGSIRISPMMPSVTARAAAPTPHEALEGPIEDQVDAAVRRPTQ
jgi:hypothetical protein